MAKAGKQAVEDVAAEQHRKSQATVSVPWTHTITCEDCSSSLRRRFPRLLSDCTRMNSEIYRTTS
jgi:hypothetical protein